MTSTSLSGSLYNDKYFSVRELIHNNDKHFSVRDVYRWCPIRLSFLSFRHDKLWDYTIHVENTRDFMNKQGNWKFINERGGGEEGVGGGVHIEEGAITKKEPLNRKNCMVYVV